MYLKYFRLHEYPFSLTPDPRFLFLTERHREGMAHLLYGMMEEGGFVQLTGEVGTGKTTLCRSLLARVPDKVDVALILNPRLTDRELVAVICDELGVTYPSKEASLKDLVAALNEALLASFSQGRRTVVVIDEAQALPIETLEQLRLLTNLETTTKKLLQVILIGQPELNEIMGRPEVRQLDQRITARFHLTPLSPGETRAYILHRLAVAGCADPLFTKGAMKAVHRLSGGIPRKINILCDRALLGAFAVQERRVSRSLVRQARNEIMGLRRGGRARMAAMAALTGVFIVAAALLGWHYTLREGQSPVAGPVPERSPPVGLVAPKSAQEAEASGGGEEMVPRTALSFETFVRQEGGGMHEPEAVRLLLRTWGLSTEPKDAEEPCGSLEGTGYRCLRTSGGWEELRRWNRPSALEMGGTPPIYAVIVALDGKEAAFLSGEAGGLPRRFPLEEVRQHWQGGFLTLWRPPPFAPGELLRPGARGPQVIWLRGVLARLEGARGGDPEEASPLYDPALVEKVKRFQKAQGLDSDGVVGERTLMALEAALAGDPGAPSLGPR